MPRRQQRSCQLARTAWTTAASLALCSACNAVLELDRFTVRHEQGAHGEGDASAHVVPCTNDDACPADRSVCSVEHKTCVAALDARCTEITGDLSDSDALRLGAMFSLHGPMLPTNRARQHGAQLAVEEINEAGGIPDADSGTAHKLVLVTCDTADDPLLAGRHLIEDLGVSAIIGPNSSEDTLSLTTRLSVAKDTLTISPTAMASSLRDLADDDLSWLMVPTDAQRAPLLQAQINELERAITSERPGPVKEASAWL